MRVLVTGAYGFIGARIVAALQAAGHEPVAAVREVRRGERFPGVVAIACDFARDTDPQDWLPRLAGIDALVNCVGILRERGEDTHRRVHEEVPAALFAACTRAGLRRVVQISALGDPADGEFIASKQRGDQSLMALALDWVVLRPSVVVSTRGSYGGTSLLRGLAALPVVPLPGSGAQRLQPIDIDDLCRAVLAALERPQAVRCCLELGGPAPMSLRSYLTAWRQWLGLGPARFLAVPAALARLGPQLADRIGHGPMGMTLWRMLERGNVLSQGAAEHAAAALGFAPRALDEILAGQPAHSADRWHARLHFLAPALRLALALTFLASGLVGLCLPAEHILALFAGSALHPGLLLGLGWGGSVLDILLGALLLAGWRPRLVLAAMAALVLGYTLFIGLLLPAAWLDPFGGLLKNPLVLLALAVAAATAERD